MCKKSLLMMLLLALLVPWAAQAQEELTVYDGDATNGNVPVYGFYADAYNKAEMIMSADELSDMAGGTISGLTWYLASPAAQAWGGNFQVYLAEVTDATFTTFLGVDNATLVWEGPLDGTGSTIELEFTSGYTYSGGNLFIAVYQSVEGTYKSATFAGSEVASASISNYSYTSLDAITSGTVRNFLPKTTFTYTPSGSGVTCARPTGLAINYTGGTTAEVSWISDATAWNIDVNGTVTAITTNPYTLPDLELGTAYTVKVQADCGGGDLSDWSGAKSFTTDLCLPENMCELRYELVDSYGDGWNGNAIKVVDAATNTLIANLTMTSGSSASGTFSVCDGRAINFVWVTGSFAGETSYTFYDINNEELFSGSAGSGLITDYTVNCTPATCPKPHDLTVSYTGGTEATISWTSDAEAWNMRVNGVDVNDVITNPYTLTGLELATTYEVEVQTVCDDATSDWTLPVSFNTDLCMPEYMCELTFVLTDSYGDGWNGAYIDVVDVETGFSFGHMSNNNTAKAVETETYTLAVCDGREIQFVWHSGNYDSECSFVIKDINEEEIVSGDPAALPFNYTVNCTVITCRRPSNLAVSEIGKRSAVLSWTENGEATEWVVEYTDVTGGGAVYTYENVSNPYTLVGLFPESEYSVRVRPVCSDFDDKWSDAITFTTADACPEPSGLNVTALMPTSAVINWTGLAETYDLRYAVVPAGKGAYSNHTPKVIDPFRRVNTNVYLTSNKDAQIGPRVTKEVAAVAQDRAGYLQYCTETFSGGVGTGEGSGTVYWGIRFPAADLAAYMGQNLTQVGIFMDEDGDYGWNYSGDYTASVYFGGEYAPETLVTSATETLPGDYEWHDIVLPEPVAIDGTQDLWLVFSATGIAYPMIGCDYVDNANSDFLSLDGTAWEHANDYGLGYTWMIRGLVEPNVDPSEYEWVEMFGLNANSCPIDPLTPSTTYIVQVRSACGDDGESDWITTYFVTPSLCDLPFNLTAEDITFNSAKLNWAGYQESFNLRYRRTPYFADTYFYEDFENGIPAEWTIINNDTIEYNWLAISEIPSTYSYYAGMDLSSWAHGGSDAAASGSFINGIGAVTTDQYLVSPQVELNGTLVFYATSKYSDPDSYEVLLSTTGTEISDFNITLQAMTGASYGAWDEVLIDLSAYAGQQGYIAIHHVDYDKYFLIIDDFGIYANLVEEEWTNVSATETTYTALGLTPEAEYEWQVQGINEECGELEWVAGPNFTTPKCIQTIALAQGWNWVSTYVEITLDDLKAALLAAYPDAAINQLVIKGNGVGQTAWNPTAHRWIGQLTTMNLSQMYMVKAPEAGEITLEGMPIDVTTLELTINPGVNWIAFPLSQGMSLAEAFAGFSTNQDVVKGNGLGQATWNNNAHRWVGQLQNLVPGQGYIYNSKATESKPFYYPAAAK